MSKALGPQGATVVDRLRLTVDPATGEPAAAAIRWPDFQPMGYGPEATAALRLQQLETENAELRARVADLEHALRLADSERTQAVAAVEKRERMREAKTHGGRLPSFTDLWR